MGLTTKTASVVPAARPARKTEPVLTLPLSSAIQDLYNSKDENRIAILGTIPETTAPSPLYKAQNDSFLTIFAPTPKKPRRCPYLDIRIISTVKKK